VNTVLYQPYDGSDGLQSRGDEIVAWSAGAEVARAPLSREKDIQVLLSDFDAVDLFPDLQFTVSPEEIVADLELDLKRLVGGVLLGEATFLDSRLADNSFYWEAEYSRGEEFLLPAPPGSRPWADAEEMGYGWKIFLPETVLDAVDSVFHQRIGLAIEAFLYALASRQEIPIPYLRRVSNIFSASNPAWKHNIPHILRMP
jgi:hypothetical protein